MIGIHNQTKCRIPRCLITKTLKQAASYLKIKTSDLSVVFVNQGLIKKLNAAYRRRNSATDILSFVYDSSKDNLSGEIVICYPLAVQHAKKYGHSINQEISKLLIHGLLHLIGYNHQNKKQTDNMEKLENKIINKLKI